MVKSISRELEMNILQTADDLIEVVTELGNQEGEQREALIREAVRSVVHLAEMFFHVMEGNVEHIEALLRQLIRQKLPDQNIMKSFGSFNEDLEEVIGEGLKAFFEEHPLLEGVGENECNSEFDEERSCSATILQKKQPAETLAEDATLEGNAEIPDKDNFKESEKYIVRNKLEEAIKFTYPESKIVRGYEIRGYKFDYYLPEHSLIIEKSANVRHLRSKEYYCRKQGIKLVTIFPEELHNIRNVAKLIRRRAALLP